MSGTNVTKLQLFSVTGATGQTLTCDVAGTARITLPTNTNAVMVYNGGIVPVYILGGDVTATAVATSMVIPAGSMMAFDAKGSTHIAGHVASGTQAVLVYAGTGF